MITRAKPSKTSKAASTLSRRAVFLRWFVPASQWGTRSATKCDKIAAGIPITGFTIFVAMLAPIRACAVAVIYNLRVQAKQFLCINNARLADIHFL